MKNSYEIRGNVTAIIINSPKYGRMEALISTRKLQRADEFPCSWYAKFDKRTKSFYAHGHMPRVNGKQETVCLHRWITNVKDGTEVDHFNHETLDNTDSNVRVITHAENQQNKRGAQSNSKSGIRGVFWNKRDEKWLAQIKLNNKQIHIGTFQSIEKAEQAVIEARKKYMPYSQEAYKTV